MMSAKKPSFVQMVRGSVAVFGVCFIGSIFGSMLVQLCQGPATTTPRAADAPMPFAHRRCVAQVSRMHVGLQERAATFLEQRPNSPSVHRAWKHWYSGWQADLHAANTACKAANEDTAAAIAALGVLARRYDELFDQLVGNAGAASSTVQRFIKEFYQ